MRLLAPALSLGMVIVSVAACMTAAPSAGTTVGAPPIESSAPPSEPLVWLPEWAGADVPDAVTGRRPLPFCGVERAPQPQPGIFVDRAVRLCFWSAHLARTEAEFVSLQSTMEGSPIATIWRLASDGTVEQLVDLTQDAFGGGGWQAVTCARLVEGEGDELLGVADCVEGVTLE